MRSKMFPVLEHDYARQPKYTGPREVPWDFIAENEAQCKANHDQTVQRLAERGGLGADEICAVVEGRRWYRMTREDATARLVELLDAWQSNRRSPPPEHPHTVALRNLVEARAALLAARREFHASEDPGAHRILKEAYENAEADEIEAASEARGLLGGARASDASGGSFTTASRTPR